MSTNPVQQEKHIALLTNLIKAGTTKEVRIPSYTINMLKQQVNPGDKLAWIEGN